VKFDGDEDGVEKDENNNEPVEQLRLHYVTNFEPASDKTPQTSS